MKIDIIESTNEPEKVMCLAARGDYMEGWNAEKSFKKIMSSVSYDSNDLDRAVENNYYPDKSDETEAAMISLIEKQLSKGHYGPAEHPQATFSVKGLSRVTMAQITRHRHMTFDIQSQRYANFSEKDEPFVVPPILLEPEERKNRYPNVFEDTTDIVSRHDGVVEIDDSIAREYALDAYLDMCHDAMDYYERMVEHGIPKEDARYVLPVGTKVNMTFSGNARTFMHVFNLRRKANSQWEIRELSERMSSRLKEWMPYSFGWYEDNMPHKIGP